MPPKFFQRQRLNALLGAAFLALSPSALIADAVDEFKHRGTPFYQFFSDKDFKSNARGLQIAVSPNNTIFYSQERMLRSYNGIGWENVYSPLPQTGKITAIDWIDGVTYIGSFDSIGKLVIDDKNEARYRSFFDEEQREAYKTGQTYTDIKKFGDRIVFTSLRAITFYDPETGNIEFQDLDNWVRCTFIHDNTLFAATDNRGVLEYRNGKFETDKRFEDFKGTSRINDAARHPNGDTVLGTHTAGLYKFDGRSFTKAYPNFQNYQKHPLNDIQFTRSDQLLVCLGGKGIIVLDEQGNSLSELTSSLDFRFANPRKTIEDENGVVWALFNSYVARFILNSPLTTLDERLRPPLDYPQAHIHQGRMYLCNRGILSEAVYDRNQSIIGFRNKFPYLKRTVVLSADSPRGIFLRLEKDIYEFDGQDLNLAIPNAPFQRMQSLPGSIERFIGIGQRSIKLYQRIEDSFEKISETENSGDFAHNAMRDAENNVWLMLGMQKVSRIWIEGNQVFHKVYGADYGLPDDWISLWNNQGEILLASSSGALAFDRKSDSFYRSTILDSVIPKEKQDLFRVATDASGNVFVFSSHGNAALWRNEDGSYEIDRNALAPMGDLYFESVIPVENGSSIFITAQQMFHFDPNFRERESKPKENSIRLSRISDAKESSNKYLNIGYKDSISPLIFDSEFRNIAFHLSNDSSNSIRQTYYQYFLEGFSTDWSPWAPNSKVLFTNLEHGDYTLRVNAQFGNGNSIQTLTRNFTIEPLLHETGIAYSAYILLGVGFVYLGFAIYSRRLKYQNLKLERMIFERTHEIELKNRELEKQAEMMETKNLELATQSEETLRNSQELASALAKLQNAQDQLLVTARKAGMAEVATNVLHNVGNVLNSINIGIVNLATKISKFRGPKLEKIVELINENRRNLGDFITKDPKGSAIPDYLAQLSKVMMEEFESCLKETDGMKENIDHVKRIIAAQQAHAKNVDVIQEIDLNELVDSAIDMILGDTKNSACKVMLDLQPELVIESDKHKILQILTNFVKNAKEAIKEAKREVGYINIEGKYDPPKNSAILTISDNGIGIENEDLQKIFTHGFTTKADGHGFGMHSCANNVKTLGGELMIESRGKGHGATVILILPRHANTQRKEQSKKRTNAL